MNHGLFRVVSTVITLSVKNGMCEFAALWSVQNDDGSTNNAQGVIVGGLFVFPDYKNNGL